MVKATTFEILGNFKAVMEELQIAFEEGKTKRYSFSFKGKRFPYFCDEKNTAYHRCITTKRYMVGKYYSDAPYLFRAGWRNRVEEVYNRHFNKDNKKYLRGRKRDENKNYTETEEQYRDFCIKTLVNLIQENDPETIEYYKEYMKKHYDAEKWESKGGFESYITANIYIPYECGNAFLHYITTSFNRDRHALNEVPPYYTTYKTGMKETKICCSEFYSSLFTSHTNFSLLKIKYAKGGKITNAGLKATPYYYYNGEVSNWEFCSHSKKDDLENMCNINNIKYPKGSKYEDLAKLLKEKLP